MYISQGAPSQLQKKKKLSFYIIIKTNIYM